MNSDAAGIRLSAVGKAATPLTNSVPVRVAVMVSPWYGRPICASGSDGEAVSDGRPEAGTVAGISMRMVPKVPPGVGCRVRKAVVLPG